GISALPRVPPAACGVNDGVHVLGSRRCEGSCSRRCCSPWARRPPRPPSSRSSTLTSTTAAPIVTCTRLTARSRFCARRAGAGGPTVKRFAELAADRDLFLQAHVDDGTIEKLLTLYPKTRFLWAHAGMSSSASTVGGLLARFPKLWVELALRTDVAPGGTLDPEWRAVFVKHPDRFMVGTDTWVTSRWEAMQGYHRDVQTWLGQLPRDVAEAIAW